MSMHLELLVFVGLLAVNSPNGRMLALVEQDGAVSRSDATGGKPVGLVAQLPDYVLAVAFSADGEALVACCRDGQTGTWDARGGKQRTALRPPPDGFTPETKNIPRAHLTDKGDRVAFADSKRVLHVWETATGKLLYRIADPEAVQMRFFAFSPDGTRVALKYPGTVVRLVDVATGKALRELTTPDKYTRPCALSPDGRTLAGSTGGSINAVTVWDTATGKELHRWPWRDATHVRGAVFSPDSKHLLAVHNPLPAAAKRKERPRLGFRLWDLDQGRPVRQFHDAVMTWCQPTFSPDGRTVALAVQNTVYLYESARGTPRGRFSGHSAMVAALAFSPDGRLLASGGWDRSLRVWDVTGLFPDGKWTPRDVQPGDLQRLWGALGGADGERAYRAMWALAAADRQSIPFLAKQVRPAAPVEKERLARLLADLVSDQFAVRDRASRELEIVAELAEPALREALGRASSQEVRGRLEKLLEPLEQRTLSPAQLHAHRAIKVLEHAGTKEARQLLTTLAGGAAEAHVTREAKAALERLARKSR